MTNETAERLRPMFSDWDYGSIHDEEQCKRDAHGCRCACHYLDAALATERRNTVERIRARLVESGRKGKHYLSPTETRLLAILDEVAS